MSEPSRYRPLVPYPRIGRVTMAVSVFLGLFAAALLFAVDFMLAQLADLPFLRDGFPISDLEIAINHARMTGIGRAVALLTVVTAVLWLIWQYRAHANLRSLRLPRTRFSPPAGVVAWIVPVVNLVLPLLAIRELWRVPDPDTGAEAPGAHRGRSWTSPLVWGWWASFLAMVALAEQGFSQAPRSNASPEQLIARNHWLIPACLVGMAAAVLAIFLVNRIVGRIQLKEDQVRFPGWEAWTSARTRHGPVSRD
jgi:hypothetical protein